MKSKRTGLHWLRGGILLAVPIALFGELGHHLLDQLGRSFAHHLFHILFGAGAIAVFAVVLLLEVRRNGWPSFSLSLRPDASRQLKAEDAIQS